MLVRQRIHQQAFRERVVAAYRSQCAMCRLRHASLLDAAHIVPDSEEGEPAVSNGLALCKLHHAAFDNFLVSVTPDYSIQVRASVLEEEDGPILEHGLKGIQGWSFNCRTGRVSSRTGIRLLDILRNSEVPRSQATARTRNIPDPVLHRTDFLSTK
jgi:putative restriction endonuclease